MVKEFLDDGIYVCAKKAMVKQRNEEHLRMTGNPVAKIPSINVPDIQCSEDDNSGEGLQTTLRISIGTKIMLTHNLCVSK